MGRAVRRQNRPGAAALAGSAPRDEDAHPHERRDGGRETDPGVEAIAGDQRALRDG
jgi:hypothetical protein